MNEAGNEKDPCIVNFPLSFSLSGERRDSEKLGIRTAEKLLKEFHPHTVLGQTRLTMLQCYCLMATKDKTNVEAALSTFTEMATREVMDTPSQLHLVIWDLDMLFTFSSKNVTYLLNTD